METLSVHTIVALGAMGCETDDKTILSKKMHTTKMQNLGKSNTKT